MASVADTQELRAVLDRFVGAHVAHQQAVISARISEDDQGAVISVKVEPGHQVELPVVFEEMRVLQGEREPGYVAAGPLTLR
ncbi:MAG TPA: hypothetical protein VN756_00755 [Solirubrobacterales bacterium]|nr:hypothetical protein [Solirubrobacterales bacterium]